MTSAFRLCCLLLVVAVPALLPAADPPSTSGRDWPMFGGTPVRNMANALEKGLPSTWAVKEGERKGVKWAVELGSNSYGGPVVAGGKVFVGTNNSKPRDPRIKGDKGVVLCLHESDGQFLWQAVHDKLPNAQENDFPQQGVASTPVVEGNRVYYVSNRCELICADTEGFLDGKNDGVQDEKYKDKTDADIIWRLDMIKDFGVFPCYLANCSPVIGGDLVFVITGNGTDAEFKVPAPQAPSFLAVNKKTGQVVWKSSAPGEQIMEGQWSNPTYAVVNGKAQVIFPGGDGWLYAFEPETGKLIWKFDCNPKGTEFKQGNGTRAAILATPVVWDSKVYVGTGNNPDKGAGVGHFWCLDMTKSGDVSAEVVASGQPEPNKNSAVVWHYGGPSPKGSPRDFVFGRTLSTAAIHDGLVYLAELDGFLHCLDAKTGKKYWEHDLKSGVWGSAYYADGKVYLGNEDGDLYVFAAGKDKKLLGQVEMERSIKSTPVAVNGVLYVMTQTHLYAITNK